MRRSQLGPGQKSRERGSTFANQGAGLARTERKPVKHRKRPLRTASTRERSEAWARGGRAKCCAICGSANVQGHHIVYQQRIRRAAQKLGLDVDRLLWDDRNRLWLCPRHHDAAHSRARPVSRSVLERHAPKVFQFTREIGELPWLERMYPVVQPEEHR